MLSGLLATLVLVGSFLSVSPELHHAFHAEADDANHLCIAVLLSHHGAAPSDSGVSLIYVAVESPEVLQPAVIHLQSVDLQQVSSGRAPPFAASV